MTFATARSSAPDPPGAAASATAIDSADSREQRIPRDLLSRHRVGLQGTPSTSAGRTSRSPGSTDTPAGSGGPDGVVSDGLAGGGRRGRRDRPASRRPTRSPTDVSVAERRRLGCRTAPAATTIASAAIAARSQLTAARRPVRRTHASSRRMTGKRASSMARTNPTVSQNAGLAALVASGAAPTVGYVSTAVNPRASRSEQTTSTSR